MKKVKSIFIKLKDNSNFSTESSIEKLVIDSVVVKESIRVVEFKTVSDFKTSKDEYMIPMESILYIRRIYESN